MKIIITTYEAEGDNIGKMSKETFDALPSNKRSPLYSGNVFYIGDFERPIITVYVLDENTLDKNTLYLSERMKDIYYKDRNEIEV